MASRPVSGWYHSLDDVDALLLRLTLRVPTGLVDETTHSALDVRWQQKVFGPREALRYSAAARADAAVAAASPLEREYIELHAATDPASGIADGLAQVAAAGVALYTYTDRDLRDAQASAASTLLAAFAPAAMNAPARHAQRERCASTMLVVAAVGIDAERLRAGDPDTPMTEVLLAVVRAYAPPTSHGTGGAAAPLLLEALPGFSQPIALDATLQLAASAAGLSTGGSFAPGRYGGALALRHSPLREPVVVEVHPFYAGGVRGEYWVQSVAEDDTNDGDEENAAVTPRPAARRPALVRGGENNNDAPVAAAVPAGFERYLTEVSDPAEVRLAAERRAVAAAAARWRRASPWEGPRGPPALARPARPPPTAADAFSYTAFVELVAAAGFHATDLFVAWELQLPPGWALQDEGGDVGCGDAQAAARTGAQSPSHRHRDSFPSTAAAVGVTQLARSEVRPWVWGRGACGNAPVAASLISAPPAAVQRECVGVAPLGGTAASTGGQRSPFSDSGGPGRGGPFSDSRPATLIGCQCGGADGPFAAGGCGAAPQQLPVAHLGVPFELHLTWDAARAAAAAGAGATPACGAAPPSLLLTVVSQDAWARQRIVGYAAHALPLAAGCADSTARCWAPLPPTAAAAEADFFVGGGVRLRDARDAGVPADVAAAAAAARPVDGGGAVSLSRIGLRTRTTGVVAVRCSVVTAAE